MSFKTATVSQNINGVPFQMVYDINFVDGFDPSTASKGAITSAPNGAVVNGVYDYTPGSPTSLGTFSMGLTCTVGGKGGPQPDTSTVFVGTLDGQAATISTLVHGKLCGIPPYSSNPNALPDFATGLFSINNFRE
ncbi:hypothetical protein ACQUFY_26605 (plasmid) [Robbsia andropogonis]|uniref:hypothetical protein n=1 Tax=Robbsia andropogonis TaxID=28092 RepID=UPI003D1AFCC8